MTHKDWNPGQYGAFLDVRLQPALDLLQAVGSIPEGDLIDLGCGAGVVGPALAKTYPGRQLVGVDTSPAMLAEAEKVGVYHDLIKADAADWTPVEPPALMFSNAVLQWVPDHSVLLPRLVACLEDHGVLAVQIPHQQDRPSGAAWREAFRDLTGGAPDSKQ